MDCLINFQRIDINKINDVENQILMEFKESGFIIGTDIFEKFNVTRDFYNFMTEIIYLGYVDLS